MVYKLKRICSEKKHMREMNLWFLKLGFPENIVNQELGKVKFSKSSGRANKRDKGVCLVVTYHPLAGFLIDTLIYFILIKKLKEFLHLVPWLRFAVQGKVAAK